MRLNNIGKVHETVTQMKALLPEFEVRWSLLQGKDVVAISTDNKYMLIDLATIKNLDKPDIAETVQKTIRKTFERGNNGQDTHETQQPVPRD